MSDLALGIHLGHDAAASMIDCSGIANSQL